MSNQSYIRPLPLVMPPLKKERTSQRAGVTLPRTFSITEDALNILDGLVARYSAELQVKLNRSKVVDLAIFYIRNKSLKELMVKD